MANQNDFHFEPMDLDQLASSIDLQPNMALTNPYWAGTSIGYPSEMDLSSSHDWLVPSMSVPEDNASSNHDIIFPNIGMPEDMAFSNHDMPDPNLDLPENMSISEDDWLAEWEEDVTPLDDDWLGPETGWEEDRALSDEEMLSPDAGGPAETPMRVPMYRVRRIRRDPLADFTNEQMRFIVFARFHLEMVNSQIVEFLHDFFGAVLYPHGLASEMSNLVEGRVAKATQTKPWGRELRYQEVKEDVEAHGYEADSRFGVFRNVPKEDWHEILEKLKTEAEAAADMRRYGTIFKNAAIRHQKSVAYAHGTRFSLELLGLTRSEIEEAKGWAIHF